MPILDACFGKSCKFLQAPVRSGANSREGLDLLALSRVQIGARTRRYLYQPSVERGRREPNSVDYAAVRCTGWLDSCSRDIGNGHDYAGA
jgi:hypothetical protein